MKFKRKKNSRQRAGTTHGWGSMKKHRGAGHRGGRGNAGSGKRGDAKKTAFLKKGVKRKGKSGFKKKGIVAKIKTINLGTIEERLQTYVKKKLVAVSGDVYEIDIVKLGYNKLLSSGRITKKFKITTPLCSSKVLDKVKAAGGAVITPSANEEAGKEDN